MAQERFQVTRSGREIYAGGLDGLVEAAARGDIRANDLVFDPDGDRWLFARNLPALAGFALRGRQARGTEDQGRQGPIRLERFSLERRGQRRRRIAQALALLAVIGATVALVRMVPDAGDKRHFAEFIDDRAQAGADAIQRAGDGRPGAPAAVAPRPSPNGPGGAAVAPATGAVTAAAADPNGGREAPTAGDPMAGAALAEAALPEAAAQADAATARAPVGPPAELVFDYAQRDAPGVFVEPTPDERRRYAARYTAEGMRALQDPDPPPGDARLAQLLAARHRAEFARLNLAALDPEHPDLPMADQLIADLEAAFTAVCVPAYGERFCGLKLQYPDWPDPVVERVAAGKAEIGMTAEQAREAWGSPTRFRRDGAGRRYCYDFLCDRSLWIIDRVVVGVSG